MPVAVGPSPVPRISWRLIAHGPYDANGPHQSAGYAELWTLPKAVVTMPSSIRDAQIRSSGGYWTNAAITTIGENAAVKTGYLEGAGPIPSDQ